MLLSIVILLICTSSSISFIGERCAYFYHRSSSQRRCTHLKPIEALHDEDHFAASCNGLNQIVCFTDSSPSNGRATTTVRNRPQLHTKKYQPKEHQNFNSSQLWAWLRAKRVAESRLQHAIRSEERDLQPYFKEYKEYLSIDMANVLNLNLNYYKALSDGNINLLELIFKQSDATLLVLATSKADAECVGGYESVLSHIEQRSVTSNYYAVKDVNLLFYGHTATVTCKLDCYSKEGGKYRYSCQATNTFVKEDHSSSSGSSSDSYSLVCSINTMIDRKNKGLNHMSKRTYMDPSRFTPRRRSSSGAKVYSLSDMGKVIARSVKGSSDDDDDNDDDEQDDGDADGNDNDSSDEDDKKESNNSNIIFLKKDSTSGDDDNDEDNGETDDESNKRKKDEAYQRFLGLKGSIQNTISNLLMNRRQGSSASVSGVFVIPGSSLTGNSSPGSSSSEASIKKNSGSGSVKRNDDDDDDDDDDEDEGDDDDDDDDDEESEELMKELAARTLECVNWLFASKRLSQEEKSFLNSDVIENLSVGEYSRAEAAYALLIMGSKPTQSNLEVVGDLSDIDPDDMKDFEDFCHTFYLTSDKL